MFTTEESNNLKLIDFGLAKKLNAEKDLKILFGTPEFVGKYSYIILANVSLNELLLALNSNPHLIANRQFI